jgi:hypothetical protein
MNEPLTGTTTPSIAVALQGSNAVPPTGNLTADGTYTLASDESPMSYNGVSPAAFADALNLQTSTAWTEINKRLAWLFHRSGSGTLGQINAIDPSSGAIQLTNPSDAMVFEVGMTLQSYTTDGGSGTAQAALGYVLAVDPQAAFGSTQIVVAATPGASTGSTPSGWSASNAYLVNNGDFNFALSRFSRGSVSDR